MNKNIETKRLIIRDATVEDAEAIFEIWDPQRHRGDSCYRHYTIEQIENICREYINLHEGILKVAVLKDTNEIMGTCCIGEFAKDKNTWGYGLIISEKFYYQKFISEISNGIVEYGKKLGINNFVNGAFFNETKDDVTSLEIETDRLITRAMKPQDIDIVYKIWNDPVSLKSHDVDSYSMDYVKDICEETRTLSSSIMMVTILKATGEIVGTCRVGSVESPYIWDFGYYTHPDHRGKGYATELVKGIINKAKELGIKKVEAGAYAWNEASRRVLEKSGMVLVNEDEEDADYELNLQVKQKLTGTRK